MFKIKKNYHKSCIIWRKKFVFNLILKVNIFNSFPFIKIYIRKYPKIKDPKDFAHKLFAYDKSNNHKNLKLLNYTHQIQIRYDLDERSMKFIIDRCDKYEEACRFEYRESIYELNETSALYIVNQLFDGIIKIEEYHKEKTKEQSVKN